MSEMVMVDRRFENGPPPGRSPQQRMDALKMANDVRMKRARLKRDLRARRASIVEVLAEPPECALTAHVDDLLLAVPKFGRVKVNRLLARNMISPSKTIGGMTERQRLALTAELAGR